MQDTQPATANRLKPFGTTVFAEITAKAVAANAVNLGQGFPDFEGPDAVKDALARALREHPNQYAPMPGVPALRGAIAEHAAPKLGRRPDPDAEITVTAGCTEAIPATTLGLLNPGDRVVVFEPFYDAYPVACALAGAEPIYVPLREQPDGAFAFEPDELAAAASEPGVRALILNTPHNPTGKVFSLSELEQIARVCIEHDLIAISDEVYEELVYDDAAHIPLAAIDGMAERTVTLSSFGKTFSLTGWKVGWAIAPPHLTAGIRSAHQFITYAVNTPTQHAAAFALSSDEGRASIAELRLTLASRRDLLCDELGSLGFGFSKPKSGYFVLANHRALSEPLGIADDRGFVGHLIEAAGVAAIPPSAFYAEASRQLAHPLVRFAFCKTEATLRDAIARLERLRE
jgi:N-succinyldiaminopimelate aminotransferase